MMTNAKEKIWVKISALLVTGVFLFTQPAFARHFDENQNMRKIYKSDLGDGLKYMGTIAIEAAAIALTAGTATPAIVGSTVSGGLATAGLAKGIGLVVIGAGTGAATGAINGGGEGALKGAAVGAITSAASAATGAGVFNTGNWGSTVALGSVAGAGAGAVSGAIIDGKRGAAVGAATGAVMGGFGAGSEYKAHAPVNPNSGDIVNSQPPFEKNTYLTSPPGAQDVMLPPAQPATQTAAVGNNTMLASEVNAASVTAAPADLGPGSASLYPGAPISNPQPSAALNAGIPSNHASVSAQAQPVKTTWQMDWNKAGRALAVSAATKMGANVAAYYGAGQRTASVIGGAAGGLAHGTYNVAFYADDSMTTGQKAATVLIPVADYSVIGLVGSSVSEASQNPSLGNMAGLAAGTAVNYTGQYIAHSATGAHFTADVKPLSAKEVKALDAGRKARAELASNKQDQINTAVDPTLINPAAGSEQQPPFSKYGREQLAQAAEVAQPTDLIRRDAQLKQAVEAANEVVNRKGDTYRGVNGLAVVENGGYWEGLGQSMRSISPGQWANLAVSAGTYQAMAGNTSDSDRKHLAAAASSFAGGVTADLVNHSDKLAKAYGGEGSTKDNGHNIWYGDEENNMGRKVFRQAVSAGVNYGFDKALVARDEKNVSPFKAVAIGGAKLLAGNYVSSLSDSIFLTQESTRQKIDGKISLGNENVGVEMNDAGRIYAENLNMSVNDAAKGALPMSGPSAGINAGPQAINSMQAAINKFGQGKLDFVSSYAYSLAGSLEGQAQASTANAIESAAYEQGTTYRGHLVMSDEAKQRLNISNDFTGNAAVLRIQDTQGRDKAQDKNLMVTVVNNKDDTASFYATPKGLDAFTVNDEYGKPQTTTYYSAKNNAGDAQAGAESPAQPIVIEREKQHYYGYMGRLVMAETTQVPQPGNDTEYGKKRSYYQYDGGRRSAYAVFKDVEGDKVDSDMRIKAEGARRATSFETGIYAYNDKGDQVTLGLTKEDQLRDKNGILLASSMKEGVYDRTELKTLMKTLTEEQKIPGLSTDQIDQKMVNFSGYNFLKIDDNNFLGGVKLQTPSAVQPISDFALLRMNELEDKQELRKFK